MSQKKETKTTISHDNTIWAESIGNISWTYIKTVVDTVHEPFLILDKNLCVLAANECFYEVFKVPVKDTQNKLIYDLGDGQWDIPSLRKLLEDILPKHTHFRGYEVEHDFPTIGHKIMLLNARQAYFNEKNNTSLLEPIILLAIEDITKITDIAKNMADQSNDYKQKLIERTTELKARIVDLENLTVTVSGFKTTIEELTNAIRTLNGFR